MTLRQHNTTIIGKVDDFEFGLSDADRARNIHIMGAVASGKTSLIENMIIQDIYNKKPFIYFDFSGHLNHESGSFLNFIPNYNIDQVLYLNSANIRSLMEIEYINLTGDKSKYLDRLINSLTYKNVVDERMGVIFDCSIDNFAITRERNNFISNVLNAFTKIIESRLNLPFYRKPLFTFYLDEFNKSTYDMKDWTTLIDLQSDANISIVTANQFIDQIGDFAFEEILKMYGNLIFTKLNDKDVARISKLIKGFTVSDLSQLEKYQAIYRIFQNGERQRDFSGRLIRYNFENFGLRKIILNK
jgi:hypothetical protein